MSDAAARLTHGGRYARALAIDQLASLARDEDVAPPLQRTALRLLARHADERGTDLSEVESERLRVAFAPFGAAAFGAPTGVGNGDGAAVVLGAGGAPVVLGAAAPALAPGAAEPSARRVQVWPPQRIMATQPSTRSELGDLS